MSERESFSERLSRFMVRELGLEPAEQPRPGPWSGSGFTIGALALRLDVLDLEQIDAILDRQEVTPSKRFGELAVELGFLERVIVDRLLALQQLHCALELGERLVVAGRLEMPRMAQLVARFLE